MEKKHRLFIVEDHRLFRESVEAMLRQHAEWEVVGYAEDGLEAMSLIKESSPDLVVLDLSMPRMNGFSVLKEIKRSMPEVKVLILTIHESEDIVLEALNAKADGYALKDCSRKDLETAIRTVLGGKVYLSPEIALKLAP